MEENGRDAELTEELQVSTLYSFSLAAQESKDHQEAKRLEELHRTWLNEREAWAWNTVQEAFQKLTLGRELRCDMQTAIQAEKEWLSDARSGRSCSARNPVVNTPSPSMAPLAYHGMETTPSPVLNPMKKAAIQSQARLQAQLKEQEKAAKGARKHGLEASGQKSENPAAENVPQDMPDNAAHADGVQASALPGQGQKRKVQGAEGPVSENVPGDMPKAAEVSADGGEAIYESPHHILAIMDKPAETEDAEGKEKAGKGTKKRKPNNGPMQAKLNEYIKRRRAEGLSYQDARKSWLASEERMSVVMSLSQSERTKRRF